MIRVTLYRFIGKDYREPVTDSYPVEFDGDDEHALRIVLLTVPPDVAVLPEAKLLVEDEHGVIGGWNRRGALRVAAGLPTDPDERSPLVALRNAILHADAMRGRRSV